MRFFLDTRQTALWLAGISATLATTLLFGASYACIGAGVWCLSMMLTMYKQSGDALDARAALFFAAFVFVVGPTIAIAISGEIATNGFYAPSIRGVIIDQGEFEFGQAIVIIGLLALSVPMLFVRKSRARTTVQHRVDPVLGQVPQRAWAVYATLIVLTVSFVVVSFGGISGAISMAFDPVARDLSTLQFSSGIYGLLFMSTVVAAYYAAQRLKNRVGRLVLFLPVIPLILPAANRGVVVVALLVAALSVSSLVSRRVYLGAFAFLAALPLLSTGLLTLRYLQADAIAPFVADRGPLGAFLAETTMAPAMAFVVGLLREGRLDYVYGTDVFLIFVWFVPRALWADKPLPLDFRLNEALGLNYGTAYGTPISIFGGAYINFTPYLYAVFLAGLGFAILKFYETFKQDRLVSVFFVSFVLDLVRVGDIAREVWTLLISLGALYAVRYIIGSRRSARPSATPRRRAVVSVPPVS